MDMGPKNDFLLWIWVHNVCFSWVFLAMPGSNFLFKSFLGSGAQGMERFFPSGSPPPSLDSREEEVKIEYPINLSRRTGGIGHWRKTVVMSKRRERVSEETSA